MKHNLRYRALLGAVTFLGTTASVLAQTTQPLPTLVPIPAEKANWRVIEVKNAPASLLAYQIDPEHNEVPASFNLPASSQAAQKTKTAFELPGNIEQIVPLDAQKLLLVKGGAEDDFRRLQELVEVLDQPLRQIALETKVVELSPQDARILTFGVNFSPQQNETQNAEAEKETKPVPEIGLVSNNFTARLLALVANNRATVFSAPPKTIINNTLIEIPLSPKVLTVEPNEPPRPLQFLSILKGQTLNVVPTINGDDTISLNMDIVRESQIAGETADKTSFTVIMHLRDGDTLALKNLPVSIAKQNTDHTVPQLGEIPLISSTTPSSLAELNQIPIIGRLFRSKKIEDERTTLIFITARIIRQTENAQTPIK